MKIVELFAELAERYIMEIERVRENLFSHQTIYMQRVGAITIMTCSVVIRQGHVIRDIDVTLQNSLLAPFLSKRQNW